MTDLTAVRSLDRPDKLVLEGKSMTADVAGVITGCNVERTLDGAPTIKVQAHDSSYKLLRSGLLSDRATLVLDGIGFELVAVRKKDETVDLLFEDMVATALRRRTEPRKVNAGAMTHVDFVKLLVKEESWIKLETWPPLAGVSKTELARGEVTDDPTAKPDDTPESSWEAIERIGRDRGWRRWVRDGKLWYLPDEFLLLGDPLYRIKDDRQTGIQYIDFDFDIGKPVATATITALIGRWDVPIGEIVEITDMGPANGKWIVHTISRSAFSLEATITLVRGNPILPEPEPAATGSTASAAESDRGETGYDVGALIDSALAGASTPGVRQEPGIDVPGPKNTTSQLRRFVDRALSHKGKPYVFGHKGPKEFDCSGLVADAARAVGVRGLDGGSKMQYAWCYGQNSLIGVSAAIYTFGALLFRMTGDPTHVAISLGDGRTIEAKGSAYGVGIFSAINRNWTHGAKVPGLKYS